MIEAIGEFADWGLLSWGGDALKHSSRDPSSEASTAEPLPNWKAGAGFSTFAVLSDTEVVDEPLDLAKEGRNKEDRLRSTKVGLETSTAGNWIASVQDIVTSLFGVASGVGDCSWIWVMA